MRPILLLLLLIISGPALAQASAQMERDKVLALVAKWYAELAKRDEGRPYTLTAPGFIDASPHYEYPDTKSAALIGPPIYTSYAATALQFSYEATLVRVDPNFAKVRVWEKAYFYAAAVKQTYERAASTLFILERYEDTGDWRIVAHQSSTTGIPPNMKTDPMPDLREAWKERQSNEGADFLLPER